MQHTTGALCCYQALWIFVPSLLRFNKTVTTRGRISIHHFCYSDWFTSRNFWKTYWLYLCDYIPLFDQPLARVSRRPIASCWSCIRYESSSHDDLIENCIKLKLRIPPFWLAYMTLTHHIFWVINIFLANKRLQKFYIVCQLCSTLTITRQLRRMFPVPSISTLMQNSQSCM